MVKRIIMLETAQYAEKLKPLTGNKYDKIIKDFNEGEIVQKNDLIYSKTK